MATPVTRGSTALTRVGAWPRLRVLSWQGDELYAARGYTLLRWRPGDAWTEVAHYRPPSWRALTSSMRLTYRLARDGFHALVALPGGALVGVVAGAIVARASAVAALAVTHVVRRGTRPLNLAVTGDGTVVWGEYFDNRSRDEVHLYASADAGRTWHVAFTFPRGAIRHVHNVLYDRWEDVLWIFTGDDGDECRILRASPDLRHVDVVLAGHQQARAVAAIVTPDALVFASDTPLEQNHAYRLERSGAVGRLAPLSHASFHGCAVGPALFFSTVVEPSAVNPTRSVRIHGSRDGGAWPVVAEWRKDAWPMRWFQYGCAVLPTGDNTSGLLAATTIGVHGADLETTVWRVGLEGAP